MISPDRARAVAELDALTDQLPARADQLASRLDHILSLQGDPGPISPPMPDTVIVAGGLCIYHGPDREVLCASCMEPAGVCTLTGGREPCDGAHEAAALTAEAATAPTIHIPTGATP